MSRGVIQTVTGVAAVAIGVVLLPVAPAAGAFFISAGSGLLLSGVGTLLAQGPLSGTQTTSRNPIAPWNVRYGQGRVGGTMIFCNTFGENEKYLDLVIVLACHPCQSVDSLLLNQDRVLLRPVHNTPHGWWTSTLGSDAMLLGGDFNPGFDIPHTSDITRTENILKISLPRFGLPQQFYQLQVGDKVDVTGVHPVAALVNGRWPIYATETTSSNFILSFISGGPAIPASITLDNSGNIRTSFPDYKSKIYIEILNGQQNLGETFIGMINGTPYDANPTDLVQNPGQPWNLNCSAPGKTMVHLRLHYNDQIFSQGLPQFSFIVSGKNNIYDPRSASSGYSTNAALCIADYMTDKVYGYKLNYGNDLPNTELITAANLCDEAVNLALGGTEPRYTCNGGFLLTSHRSEILQNLLTAMAGRLTYIGGQYFIQPAGWAGISSSITGTQIYSRSVSAIQWRPKVPVNQLYNAVKGTFIAQVNNWQSSDFPPYAQDELHGYNDGAPEYFYDANLTEDQGDRRYLDVQFPFTISCPTAQRLAKIELKRRRGQGTGTFALNLSGYLLAPLDIIAVDLPMFGWTGKTLEVLAARLRIEAQAGTGPAMWSEIDIQEADSSYYQWSIGEELSPQGYQQAIVPDMHKPAPPTNFVATSRNGNMYLTWDAPQDAFVLNGGHIEIEYQQVQSPEGLWLSLAKMDPTVTSAVIENLPVGSSYNVRIRSVNVGGVPSDWVPPNMTGSPATAPPVVINPPEIWAPEYETPMPGDPLFTAKGFGIFQDYLSSAGADLQPVLGLYGQLPPEGLSLIFKVRWELVSGPWAQQLAIDPVSIDSTTDATFGTAGHGTLAFGVLPSNPLTANQFAGRIISKLANPQGSTGTTVPIQDFICTANDVDGNFTVTPDPSAVPNPPKAGDLFTARTGRDPRSSATAYDMTADLTSYTDPTFNSAYNPGLTVHGNQSNLALVIGGTGAFQPPVTVVDNDDVKVTISPSWTVIPDATSVIILVEATPRVVLPPDSTADVTVRFLGEIPVQNYSKQVVHVEGYTTPDGASTVIGPIESVPFREIYIWGAGGTLNINT